MKLKDYLFRVNQLLEDVVVTKRMLGSMGKFHEVLF